MEHIDPSVKSTEELQHDMQQTREAITEKVAALETQVIGTFQTAADTVTSTVDAVKEAVTAAPTAVSETVKQTVAEVKETLQQTIGSFSVSGCVRKNPWAAMGSTLLAGFVLGYRTGGRESANQPVAAPEPRPFAPPSEPRHGLITDLGDMVGKELRQLAEESLTKLLQTLRQSVNDRMPDVVDTAVNRVAEHLQSTPRSPARIGEERNRACESSAV